MKLNDLYETNQQFFKTKEEIVEWLEEMIIKSYIINDDLTVDVNGSVFLDRVLGMAFFPVQFGKVVGSFNCRENQDLVTLKGAPYEVTGSFRCRDCVNLKSLEYAPAKIGEHFNGSACVKITSLKDIHKHIKSIGKRFYLEDISDDFEDQGLQSDILGLLKIKNLNGVHLDNKRVQAIINKYIPEGDIFDCVDELQDAGFEEYAKL